MESADTAPKFCELISILRDFSSSKGLRPVQMLHQSWNGFTFRVSHLLNEAQVAPGEDLERLKERKVSRPFFPGVLPCSLRAEHKYLQKNSHDLLVVCFGFPKTLNVESTDFQAGCDVEKEQAQNEQRRSSHV